MNTKTLKSFRRKPAILVGALGLGMAATCSSAAYGSVGSAPPDEKSPTAAFWENTASNLNLAVDDSLYSFTLSALGINDGGQDNTALLAALDKISGELMQIDSDVQQMDSDLKLESCNLDLATAIATPVAHIRNVVTDYNRIVTDNGNAVDIQNWVNEVFDPADDGANSISENLSQINTALMPLGAPGTGVLASCLATLPKPTAGQLDDTAYYAAVQDLVNYFYDVQTEGMAVQAEAYNYKAYRAWLLANPNAKLDPSQPSSICANATGETLSDCKNANYVAQGIYKSLQDQFAFAGAPFSTTQYKILNGSNYLFPLSLEDFTQASGVPCSPPFTVNYHCGPTQVSAANAPTTTAFTVNGTAIQYGNYNQWTPATTTVLGAVLQNWTNSSQTLGDYLTGLGFQNAGDKIIFTPQTATVIADPDLEDGAKYTLGTGDCFADTRLVKTIGAKSYNAIQPFCSSASLGNLIIHEQEQSSSGCDFLAATSGLPADSTDNAFYNGNYFYQNNSDMGNSCHKGFHGDPPGYMVSPTAPDDRSIQSMWPYLDVSKLSCKDNEDGSQRSPTNPSGVPTMCGADFDGWFGNIVTKPPTV